MDLIERVADWYMRLFRGIFVILFVVALGMFVLGIVEGQYWLCIALPSLILVSGNMAVFILMYQHLESIDSKRL